MTEFWLISAPGEKTCQQTWDKMMLATTRTNNLSTNHKFNIPDLKARHWYVLKILPYGLHESAIGKDTKINCALICGHVGLKVFHKDAHTTI